MFFLFVLIYPSAFTNGAISNQNFYAQIETGSIVYMQSNKLIDGTETW